MSRWPAGGRCPLQGIAEMDDGGPESAVGRQSSMRPASGRQLLGLLGLGLMNGLALNTLPLMGGVWADSLRLDDQTIGALLTLQLLAAAVASIGLSARLHLSVARSWGAAAGAMLIAANLWFACASNGWALFAGAATAGLALGVLAACGAAAIAATHEVDRTAAIVSLGVAVLVAVLTVVVGRLAGATGRAGLFLAQASVGVVALGLTIVLPRGAAASTSTPAVPLGRALCSPLVVSTILLELGTAGIWAFVERIGDHLRLGPAEVGDMIAASSLFGIGGAALAGVLARHRRELALSLTAYLAIGFSAAMIPLASGGGVLLLALSAHAFFFVFSGPFITALAVRLDRSGGLAAATQGWGSLTGALAPVAAGVMVGADHYDRLAILALGATLSSASTLVLASRRLSARGSE